MGAKARRHRTVVVRVGATAEEIDAGIAPLMREVWTAGIPARMSCQETDPGKAWIAFEEADHLARFLNLVADYEDGADTLYNRVAHVRAGATSVPWWEYQLDPIDCGPDDDAPAGRPADFAFTVGVYIPHADLPAVLARLERHNRRPPDSGVEPDRVGQ